MREAFALPDHDAEGARHNLGIEPAFVAGGDDLELPAFIRDQAGKDVEAAGGAFRVRLAGDIRRQRQLFLQRNDVNAAFFEHRGTGEVQGVEAVLFQLARYRGRTGGEKAGADPVGLRAEPQVKRRGLNLLRQYGRACTNRAGRDQLLQRLRRQDALGQIGERAL